MALEFRYSKQRGADAYFRQGNSLYKMELYEEAIDAYTRAIRFYPNSIIAFYNRGLAKEKLGQYASAIQDFDIVIRRKPDIAEAYYSRGNANTSLKRYLQAVTEYDKAIRYKSNYVEAYMRRGAAKLFLGQHAEAIKDYDFVIQHTPRIDQSRTWTTNSSQWLTTTGELQNLTAIALRIYKTSINAGNFHAGCRRYLLEAYNSRGNAACYRSDFDEADTTKSQ